MEHITNQEIKEIQTVRAKLHRFGLRHQLDEIRRASPYSGDITSHIRLYNELRLYYDLRLQESFITRPSIIKELDFDLWISSEGCTNLDLMLKGNSPYVYDAPEGKIELHHIGQDYNGPFAELTIEEHNSNSQLLHFSRSESWRNNKALDKAFCSERSEYWKKRAGKDYVVSDSQFEQLDAHQFQKQQEYMAELRKTCEEIYSQCSAEHLDYLSDLARSYAMMHRVGAATMGEFLQNSREALQAEVRCPSCNSSKYIHHGTYRTQGEKVQRYKCRACGKVFSPVNRSLISGCSFSFRDWIKFIDCLYNGYTIKQISKACDISERTAHENRTRLFYALKLLTDKVRLQGNVVIDETYLPVSFKGNHSRQEDFVMPRAANERGGENHQRGISTNLACIVCAVDDCGNSVAKVAGTGNVSAARLKYVLKEHMESDIFCLYSDKSKAIRHFAEDCGYEIKQEKLLRKGNHRATNIPFNRDTFIVNRYLQVVNSYHSRLKRFLDRFSGISTKYLSGYLYLFAWKERNKDREPEEAYKELLLVMTEPNSYICADDIMKDGYLPDAIRINELYRKRTSVHLERDKEIYRRFASGETMVSIAADYDTTKQNISLIIQQLRKSGFAYKTQRDIERERKQELEASSISGIPKDSQECLERDFQIYFAKKKLDR